MVTIPTSEPDPATVGGPTPTDRPRFDAFISYSHASDRDLAPAVRAGLERLAKPWYRRRALSVYLDASGLEVTPGLWTTLSAALGDARYLVLLCSPEAATSDWVGREIRYWLAHRGAATILPVLTGGTWVWDDERNRLDVENSTAAHPALRDAFSEAPGYLDLSWTARETDLDLRNARFRDAIAQLAAPLHGRDKSEIEGNDVREHRRTVRTAWSAGTALAAFLVVALIAAVLAVANGNEAARERDVATSRLLATQSASREEDRPQLAGLLAVAAAEVNPTDEARGALMRMNEHEDRVTGYLAGGAGIVEASAFAPDGRTVATAGPDDPVRLWDVASRTVIAELPAAVGADLVFSPDGRSLVVATAQEMAVWDVPSRTVRVRIPGQFTSVGASRDGSRFIGATEEMIVVVDAASGGEVSRLPGLGGVVTAVALSADGRLAAAGQRQGTSTGTGTAVVWDVTTGAEITRNTAYPTSKGAVAFAPDGQTLVASAMGGGILLLTLASRTWSPLPAHERTIYDLTYTDADTIVSSAADGTVGRWSIPTAYTWDAFHWGPLAQTTGSVLAPDGRTVLSGGFDGTAVLWRLDEGWSTPVGTLSSGSSTAVDPSGRWTASIDRAGTTVEVVDRDATTRSVAVPERALTVAVDATGNLAVGRLDGTIALHDVTTGQPRRTIGSSGQPVVELASSPDGRLLAAADPRGEVVVHDTVVGREYARIPTPSGGADVTADDPYSYSHVVFSPDGTTLAHSFVGGRPRLWDVATRTPRTELRGPSSIGTTSIAYSPAGDRVAGGGMDGTVVVWDPARPDAPLATLTGPRSFVAGLALDGSGTLAAGTGTDGVYIWDLARTTEQAVLRPEADRTRPLFVRDDVLLVTDGDGVHRYDLSTAAMRARLCGIVGRDFTAEEWAAYMIDRDPEPLCAR